MDKLTNPRLLNLPAVGLKRASQGFFLKLSSIEMLNMLESKMISIVLWSPRKKRSTLLGPISFDELSLHNLTSFVLNWIAHQFSMETIPG